MKPFIRNLQNLFIPFFLLVLSCAHGSKLTDADIPWLLTPAEFKNSFLAGFTPQKATHGQLYFLKKNKTALSGFSAVYSQQLADASGKKVNFTSQVSYGRNLNDARTTVGWYFTIEERLNKFVIKTDAAKFGADEVLLIQSDSLLYLAVRKELAVYFVQIENVRADLEQVKKAIFEKIAYIRKNSGLFKSD